MYTPILDLTILDLTDFLEIPKCDSASLKTDLKIFPGVLPGAPGVSKILGLTKSLTYRSVRNKHQLRSVEDGGVQYSFAACFISSKSRGSSSNDERQLIATHASEPCCRARD